MVLTPKSCAYEACISSFLSGYTLKHVLDPHPTALGHPIAAMKTPHFQGNMCFYFKASDDLDGVTARHVLFPADEDISDFTYKPSHWASQGCPPHGAQKRGTTTSSPSRSRSETLALRRRSAGSRSGVWKGGQRAISPAAEKARGDLKKTQERLEETADAVNTSFQTIQSKIIAKLVYPACTKCCKTGITRLPAGFTHIWYRPTAHILGHSETIQCV
jgi:hypothetical protein